MSVSTNFLLAGIHEQNTSDTIKGEFHSIEGINMKKFNSLEKAVKTMESGKK